jgi:hypothetical protein
VFVVTVLGLLPMLADAAERKAAEVECTPVEEQALTYDCTIALRGRKSGEPIVDAEFKVGADMPSMPGAHSVRPVPTEAQSLPGTYRVRLQLEMSGEWALKLDFTEPDRDRVVKKLHFGGTEGHDGHESGADHGGHGE